MRNRQFDELAVCGLSAVKELERNNPSAIRRLYFDEERAPFFGGLCKKMAAEKRPYNCVKDPAELEKLSGTVHHQGVVAMISAPPIRNFTRDDLANLAKSRYPALFLDGVKNSNNIGAIVRSAVFFGIKCVLIDDENADAAATTSAFRVSEGAMSLADVFRVSDFSRLAHDARKDFRIVALDVRGKKNLLQLGAICDGKTPFLVFGNEEFGVSRSVLRECDEVLRIDGSGFLESLNVAQAATVAFYEAMKVCKKY